MTVQNSVNITPRLDAQTGELQTLINQAVSNITTAQSDNITDVRSDIAQAVIDIIAEVNENQAILEGLTTVSGAIDTSAGAINSHTSAQVQRIIDELVSTAPDSLHALIQAIVTGARNAINTHTDDKTSAIQTAIGNIDLSALDSAVSSRASSEQVNAIRDVIIEAINNIDLNRLDTNVSTRASTAQLTGAKDDIVNEIQSTESGSLFQQLRDALTNVVNTRATPANVNAARDAVNAEIVRTSSGSLYRRLLDAITSVINTRATPTDIASQANRVISELVRTSTGSLYQLLTSVINTRASTIQVNAARDNVKNEITRTTTGSLFQRLTSALNATINSRATPANVNAARDAVNAEITRTTSGSLFQRLNARINTRAEPADINNAISQINEHTSAHSVIQSIQRGTSTVIGTDLTVTIAPVNTAKSVLLTSVELGYSSNSSDEVHATGASARLNSATSIVFNRSDQRSNTNRPPTVEWQVIEYV